MRYFQVLVWVFLLGLGISPAPGAQAPAGKAASATDTLDLTRIHAEYGEGNFETVVQILENFRAQHPQSRARDSFFVAKFLGVVYTANPSTKEKGKYWLYRMLQIDPSADLVDLYVGEEIDNVFQKVRQEFIVRRNYRGINDAKLAKSVQEGQPPSKDTVILKDTVLLGESGPGSDLPERKLSDFKRGWTGNINLGLGLKFLDKDAWDGVDQQTEMRLAFDVRQSHWPINIAFDYQHSFSKENFRTLIDSSTGEETVIKYSGTSDEMNAGVRKIFDRKLYTVRPFVGLGLGYISTSFFRNVTKMFQQGNIGVWAEGGVYWELERHFNVGLVTLWSWAEIPFEIESINAGGMHLQMLVGYHW
jgi:hypothetical protein